VVSDGSLGGRGSFETRYRGALSVSGRPAPAAAAAAAAPSRSTLHALTNSPTAFAPLVAVNMPYAPVLRRAHPLGLAHAEGLPPASFAAWDAARTRTAVKADISSFVLGVLINMAALHSLNLDSRGRSYLACLSVIYLRGLWMCVCHPEAHRVQPRSGPRSRCGAAAASGGTAAGLLSGTCSAHLPPCIPGAGAQGEGAAYA
jgi:hypothetical protein